MSNVGKVVWADVGSDLVGIMPCGLTVAVLYVSRGSAIGAYRIRFGVNEHPDTFWGMDRAKHEAILLAAATMRSCLEACDAEVQEWEREQTKRPKWDEQQ